MATLKSFYVGTTRDVDIINIGHDVRGLIRDARMENGWVSVGCRLPGGIVAILSNQGGEAEEIRRSLKKEFQEGKVGPLRHLFPSSLTFPIEKGRPFFDPWQEVYLIDHDPRGQRREIVVQLTADPAEDQKTAGGRK